MPTPPPPPPHLPSHGPPPDPRDHAPRPTGAGPDTEASVATFATPRRLHPASVLLGVPLVQLVQALILPVFATVAAGRGFTLGLLVIIGVVGLVARILDWHYRSFSFDGEVLRLEHGVLSRNHRSLDVARIQQVEIRRGAVQRLFGLAAIRVETAGGASEPEVELRVLHEDDAVALRAAVRASKRRVDTGGESGSDDAAAPTEEHQILAVPMRHVVVGSVTGARLLVLPALLGGALQLVGQQIGAFADEVTRFLLADDGVLPGFTEAPEWSLVLAAAGITAVLAVALAAIVGVLRDGRFRIVRIGEDLHISRGLLSTRDSVVPLRRIQLVEVRRNWLRDLLGYATVRIRSAGSDTEGRVSVPLLHQSDVDDLLAEILPNVDGTPSLRAHPPAARRRALFRWLRPAAAIVAVAWLAPETIGPVTPPSWLAPASLALIPLNSVLALLEHRRLAHGVTELVVASRRGAISVTTSIAPLVKVQTVGVRRSPFQRRLGLATVAARIAGSGAVVEVLDAAEEDAAELTTHLTRNAASPTPVVPTT